MTTPIKPGTAAPTGIKTGDAAAGKAVGEADQALFKRLSELFKTAAANPMEVIARGQALSTLSSEEARQLMTLLIQGKMSLPTTETKEGEPATFKGLAQASTGHAVVKTLGAAEGPLAGRALDHSVQQIRPLSAGANGAPAVPHPSDPGSGGTLAPFFRWLPRRKTWRQFKRWLERNLLKRDLGALEDETYEIIEEEDESQGR